MLRNILLLLLLSAAAVLAQPEKTAWDLLRPALGDKGIDRRRQAVTAIASIGTTSETVPLIEDALKDSDSLVRQTAAAELGLMKSTQSIPALKAVLDDTSAEVAFAAAKALWDLGDKSGRDLIEDVLTGRQNANDGMVSEVKRKMHDPKSLAMMGFKEASGALLGPFNIGLVAAEQAFKDGSVGARTLATTMLGPGCDAQTLRLLERSTTNDKSWVVKAAAANGCQATSGVAFPFAWRGSSGR